MDETEKHRFHEHVIAAHQREKEERLLTQIRGRTALGLASFYRANYPEWELPPHLYAIILGLVDTRIKHLMINVGPGCGKSQLISVTYPAWLLGHNPKERVLCISGAEKLAEDFVHGTMELIDSDVYNLFFPTRKPDKEAGWSSSRGVYVTGRPKGLPDASYYAAGLTSRTLPGKHGSTLIMDDLHTWENSSTKHMRDAVIRKYYSDLIGRQDPAGARLIVVGRRWDLDDLYGHLKTSEDDWVVLTLPNERKDSDKYLWWDVQVPDNLECVFSELGDSDDVDISKLFTTEDEDD